MYKIMCPSMMCADFGSLESEIKILEDADIDIFHIDIMDGSFVPNFGMGLQDCEYICKKANKPVDVHLMIDNPGEYVEKFAQIGAEIIYIHPEADKHATRTLQKIKDAGAKPGICINPGTSLESVGELLHIIDYFMIMTVNPGFAGQKYLDFTNDKIDKIVLQKDKYNYKVMVDGAISPAVIKRLSDKGVDGFVLGTSSLFGKNNTYKEIICNLRKL
jgi:ribulose-phosphate 3-epimerase